MNCKFRIAGFGLGILFHVVMYGLVSVLEPGLAALTFFIWYGGSLAAGLPWSLVGLLVGSWGVILMAASVCLNGYLIGRAIDWLAAPRLRSCRDEGLLL